MSSTGSVVAAITPCSAAEAPAAVVEVAAVPAAAAAVAGLMRMGCSENQVPNKLFSAEFAMGATLLLLFWRCLKFEVENIGKVRNPRRFADISIFRYFVGVPWRVSGVGR